jgi:formiminotetrahydrofolate cyclodeaminase
MFASRNNYPDESLRQPAIDKAKLETVLIPLQVARLSRNIAHLAKDIVAVGNLNAVTDAATGALLAQTAVQASALNIRTNSKSFADKTLTAKWETELLRLEREASEAVTAVLEAARRRGVF